MNAVNKPNKSEQSRIDALFREIKRKQRSAYVLETDMIIAGRDYDPYVNTMREVQEHLRKAEEALKPIVKED